VNSNRFTEKVNIPDHISPGEYTLVVVGSGRSAKTKLTVK
jgi:hypothetical protein